MRQWKKIALLSFLLSMVMIGLAQISFRISIGSGDYYNPVGDYDYLPYAYPTGPGSPVRQIDFHEMMGQYGAWVMVAPFGRVWKPYAAPDWRPYMFGHWIQTRQYGPMWEGYEPWAWAGYHYGYWILDRGYGWVWIPGSDWHPGRVTWARSYDALGWMPTPPYGYDYSLGYLSRIGANNQFSYNDDDFAMDDFNYGGPYYDPRFRNMYYNPAYIRIQILLWNFIDYGRYGDDNYADYCYGPEYTRHVFDRRLVRISNRPITRPVLERFLRRRVVESPIELRQFRSGKQPIQVVVPAGSGVADRIRRQSQAVVREIIAPGFAEKRMQFKGQNAKNRDVVARVFRQENVRPRIETLSAEQLNDRTRKARQNREDGKKALAQSAREKLARIEKQGKFKEPRKVSIQKPQDAKKQKRKDKEAVKKQNEYYD
jgi:hypothetical protein